MSKGIQIAIDRGGTFCDVIAKYPGREDYVFKLLSVDPQNYKDAPTEGIRRVLEHFSGEKIPRDAKLKLDRIQSIRMGTTVATNALLERKGAKVLLVTTKGFKDVLVIGNQTRPDIFDLTAKKLGHLYEKVLEIDERVTIAGFSEGGGDKLKDNESETDPSCKLEKGVTGDKIRVLKEPDYLEVERQLTEVFNQGEIKTVALSLLHSYAYPAHEAQVAAIAKKIGFDVSVSHELQPMLGFVNRTSSTVADAYLSPVINDYVQNFGSGFEGGLEAFGNKLLFMQSNGGLCPWYKFTGLKAILSGPAGGMVGFGETCYDSVSKKATIGFDAGGTSTDVSRYAGNLEHIYETVVSEVNLQTPQLDISTVAAGGGSMLFWKNNMFVTGPESAGSDPGPACYKKGGPLTVTDANLFLGRLVPEKFPKIFGPNQDEPLDCEIVAKKFEELTHQINKDQEVKLTPEEVASGFLKVAVESMARPIRNLTEAKGHDTALHNLASFGGSGGQFAVSLAKNLGISNVAVHKYSSLLSAYGIQLADIVIEKQSPASLTYAENHHVVDEKIAALTAEAEKDYKSQHLTEFKTKLDVFLNMRYVGSDTHLLIPTKYGEHDADVKFIARHKSEYGFNLDRMVLVDDVQVLLIVESNDKEEHNPYQEYAKLKSKSTTDTTTTKKSKVYFEAGGWTDASIYSLSDLEVGSTVAAPAIIIDDTQTLLIEPGSKAVILTNHVLIDVAHEEKPQLSSTSIDPIQLSVFGHRFMSIAEQMGRTLQQTAISTNIKERLDFSCAIFDHNGDLIANAPHIPIHLGSMSYAVKAQMKIWEGKLEPGDVLVSNHPIAGGSHLPDITVITPVLNDKNEPIFWTASRGHHADIGSITAGSMPPNSKTLDDEGAAIVTHKLCPRGVFDEAGITKLLVDEPAKHPGGSGTRTLSDNISDLKAQVAANYKGITLLQRLIDDFTYEVVRLYMSGIQTTAEIAVRNLLKLAYEKFGSGNLKGVDYIDDGTPIALAVTIDPETGSALFDFSETGDEIYGNLNAPTAILYSAVLYVLRCLISTDIPLNNGCLKPIEFKTREGSLVSPSSDAAVVGGNVETTQRITDVILKTFQAAAGSQGTCNNLTFGTNDKENGISFGYYETICGGSGAGPTWDGQSVVQCHTTNTRMTDVEVFEKRYPVLLHEYSVRENTGGDGLHKGGNGVVRDIEFLYPLEVSCLMERRSLAPYGLLGGEDGARGVNSWFYKLADGEYRRKSLGGKCTVKVKAGDRIVIHTPGGGGFGSKPGAADGEGNDANEANGVNYPVESSKPTRLTGSVGMRTIIQNTN
ncbi:uncharacterized protein LODBEIA_P44230 [Lodderomyces beijingensis]|uniref:5-oxoprolinase n=1 Tax=Lodderomyces beijingensis TaxID=1775926 RepID=A0ABP0ZPY1_9ASCO